MFMEFGVVGKLIIEINCKLFVFLEVWMFKWLCIVLIIFVVGCVVNVFDFGMVWIMVY